MSVVGMGSLWLFSRVKPITYVVDEQPLIMIDLPEDGHDDVRKRKCNAVPEIIIHKSTVSLNKVSPFSSSFFGWSLQSFLVSLIDNINIHVQAGR